MAKKKGGGKKKGGPKKGKKAAPKKEDEGPPPPPEPIMVPPKDMPPKKGPISKPPGHLMNLTTGLLVDYLPGAGSTAFETNYNKAGEASSDVLGRLKGQGASSTGELEYVCDENKFHIDYDGYQEVGYTAFGEKPRLCDYRRKAVSYDSDDFVDEDFDWSPVLECREKKPTPNEAFGEIGDLNRTIRLADTVITKSKFDSVVLFGFGETPVQKYTLANGWIQVDVLDFGATITAMRVKDGSAWTDVVLGFDNVADYINSRINGTGGTIGRVAGTIENGQFKLVNESGRHNVQLSKNKDENHVDGGFRPLHKRIWSGRVCGERLVLSTTCADGEDGYPGRLQVWATFSLTGDCSLNVEYSARTDTVTPVSIASRLVFNLAGHNSGAESLYNHSVFVNAELCSDPSGENGSKLGLVYQTPYDFTDLKHLGCVMSAERMDEIDVHYALYRDVPRKKNPLEMTPKADMIIAAVARDEQSGRTLVVSTDQWAVRFGTCSDLAGLKGKGGVDYSKHAGFCLQTGSLPNAVNIEHFPNVFITPFETYRHATRYHFTAIRDSPDKGVLSTNQPWLRNQIQLSCDEPPPEPQEDKSEEIETSYKKTYGALEKMAYHRCTDNLDDYDSLSLHSSFTSFGSQIELPGEMQIDEKPEPECEVSRNWTTFLVDPFLQQEDIFEHSDQILVKTPEPLPPYLIGKWPLVPPKDIPLSKKECLEPPPSDSRSQFVFEEITAPGKKKMETPQPYRVEITQCKDKQEKSKNFVKVELSLKRSKEDFKVKESFKRIQTKDKTPEDLDLGNLPKSDLDLENIRIPGENVFQWFEPAERLPWYCGAGRQQQEQIPVLPEKGRRERMGAFFKSINFPEGYADAEAGTEDLHKAIKAKVECLKSHYNSIKEKKYENKTCNMK